MKRLISMTDYVLEYKINSDVGFKLGMCGESLYNVIKYANFLKQPLKLEMFVPCDEDGNVLSMPVNYHLYNKESSVNKAWVLECAQYQKALSKVLFKGFELVAQNDGIFHVSNNNIVIGVGFKNSLHKTVEDLIKYNLELTDNKM